MTRPSLPRLKRTATLLAQLALAVALGACAKKEEQTVEPTKEPSPPLPAQTQAVTDAHFVGAKTCVECHSEEHSQWHGSDHDLAMQEANEQTVLGDFDGTRFGHFGIETSFRQQDGKFFVKTPNENGVPTEYQIDYTFGHFPLQQYLIAFPGGRYQALSICWDSRPEDEGGQRWFHLYPDEKVPHDDILHWTGEHFNWNYMCADCHSTDLKKNYDLASNTYKTTWFEMNVSCEACHGPASHHLEWAKSPGDYKGRYASSLGLTAVLKEPEAGGWAIDPETLKPKRTRPLESTAQVESCARCHARRRPVELDFHHGQRFLDTHIPSLLEDLLYHPDGQIKEEVYVYGSFVQSKMFHAGVRCTDCHNPHTLKLRAPGNALCAQCHVPTKYDVPAHHHHAVGSTGAQCVECHMPDTHYMVVDPRRDHSLRIPRPDLSVKLGTPNACNQCHQDQDPKWAAQALAKWLEEDGKPELPSHFAEIIADGREGTFDAEPGLVALASDDQQPAIARATALELLARRPTQTGMQTVTAALDHPDATIRLAALDGLQSVAPAQRAQLASAMLSDPIRAVRIGAARLLAPSHQALRASPYAAAFDAALAEYRESLDTLADRPGSHVGYGLLHTDFGDLEQAEKSYRTAFRVDPMNVEGRVNLAELVFQQGRTAEAGTLLEECVRIAPDRGVVHEALGRHRVRTKGYDGALISLAEAARLMPDNAHIHYFYGVALNQLGQFDKALVPLTRAYDLEPDNPEYLVGLATICRDHARWDLALEYAKRLARLDARYAEVYEAIEAQSRAERR